MPTMNTGSRAGQPAPVKKLPRIQRPRALHQARGLRGTVVNLRAAQAVGFVVVPERSRELRGVLAGLAEREFQVQSIVDRAFYPRQLTAHCLDVGGGKAKRLQIGEAPPGDCEIRYQLETPAVRADGLVLPTRGL